MSVYAAVGERAEAAALAAEGRAADASRKRQQADARLEVARTKGPGGSFAERFEHVRMALRIATRASAPSQG